MKNKFKIIIPIICLIIAVGASISYYLWHTHIPTKVYHIHCDTAYNPDDPREVIGSQAYVFVGFVEETHDYMTEKYTRQFPERIKLSDRAKTECVVKVIKNIKGELKEGSSFSFYKGGGISENRQYIELYNDDLMPEVGKYYIFTGYAHEDGTVTGGGPNGTIELESGINDENLEGSKIYLEYVDAYENQVIFGKNLYTEFLAKTDKNYGDGSHNVKIQQELLKEEELYQKHAEEQSMTDEKYQKKYPHNEYYNAVKKGNPKIK